jgi:hypothetical protein
MLNRSINIAPVISFFEPCTISLLVDATVDGSSYLFRQLEMERYIDENDNVHRGWRQSVIILIYFSCSPEYYMESPYLQYIYFYHSTQCGPENTFPNQVFVSNSPPIRRRINRINFTPDQGCHLDNLNSSALLNEETTPLSNIPSTPSLSEWVHATIPN